ncbi:NUDIX hydrolase [Promicromonospora sp. NPDC023805]|uniref:NUDIX hydrolase n=1 Tax=Promicromonospora sp. NPDC023805 TaxID=3154696 RepID=UPI0033C52727
MKVLLLVGSDPATQKSAARIAIEATAVDQRNVIVLEPIAFPVTGTTFNRRLSAAKTAWRAMIQNIAEGAAPLTIVLTNTHQITRAGPECLVGTDELVELSRTVADLAGTLEVAFLMDDVYASVENRSSSGIAEALMLRHLQLTHLQKFHSRVTDTHRDGASPLLVALRSGTPILESALLSSTRSSVYLCYPINVFRRDRQHPLAGDLLGFRKWMSDQRATIYDPLAIDEEYLISGPKPDVTERLLIGPNNRFPEATERPLVGSVFGLQGSNSDLSIGDDSWSHIARRAKAQVPERDFFWIDASDAVVSWRPFLGGMHHAGVLSELQYALHAGKEIIAYSPPEDGTEHPSPFAAMIRPMSSWHQFMGRVREVTTISRSSSEIDDQNMPKYCDHTSVGILIFNERNEILMIDRGTFPFGIAPPAGHVDQHGSYEQAAIEEAKEEVGLDIHDVELVSEGRVENRCRRINGSWHYWKVYRAYANGALTLSPRETKGAEWCNVERLKELGALEAGDGSPEKIESVWRYWLSRVWLSTIEER